MKQIVAILENNAALAGAVSALFGIVIQMLIYSYFVGRKTEKWDDAAKRSESHERRLSHIEGKLGIAPGWYEN